jgi:hypothetical protein
MTETKSGEVGPALNGCVGSDVGKLPYKSVFVITFRKIVPMTYKWSRRTRLVILYNLREKLGAKIKN